MDGRTFPSGTNYQHVTVWSGSPRKVIELDARSSVGRGMAGRAGGLASGTSGATNLGVVRLALPPPLKFPFSPSRFLAPAELCARSFGPFVSHSHTHLRSSGAARLARNLRVSLVKLQ